MKIKIPGDKAIAVYPAGGRSGYIPGGGAVEAFTSGISYLLNDNFTTALAAGSVNGTLAEPGPGVRRSTDTGGVQSISDGNINFPLATVNNVIQLTSPVSRTPGRMAVGKVNFLTTGGDIFKFGFGNALGSASATDAIYFYGTSIQGNIKVDFAATTYYLCVAQRATSSHCWIKGGAFTNWVYLGTNITGTDAVTYLTIFRTKDANALTANCDFMKVPTALWLPVPPLSTSGAMTWPTCNGLGHAETTGLGSGGSGLTMLDAGTWAVAGGYVLNTPVAGVECCSDPGFDDAAKWVETFAPGLVIGGGLLTGTALADAVITNSVGGTTSIPHRWYLSSIDLVSRTAGQLYLGNGSDYAFPEIYVPGNNQIRTFRVLSVGYPNIYVPAFTGTADNFSVKPLPISQLITNVQLATTDVLAEMVIHARTAGTQVGMAMNLDRSFAAKAAATASAGQAVLSLKEVTSGHELISNSGFDTATTGWVAGDSILSSVASGVIGNCLQVANNGANYGYAYTLINTIAGKSYTINFNCKNGTGTCFISIGTTPGGFEISNYNYNEVNWSAKSVTFVATTATTYLRFGNGGNGAGNTVLFDSVSIIEQGLSVFDTITVGGVTYAIASVTGGSNVAYNDTLKTQTITLGSDLGADVAADAKVGLDWASWNGVLVYFDDAGNIKVDEVKAGVYTNRGSTAVTFVADKRLIVRKIGTSYYIFYNEALVGSAITTIDAASQVGKYHGMFSTYNLNTIGSMVVYDTGKVTNLYSNLDKYSN